MYEFVDRSFKSSQQNHVCVLFFLQVCLNKWVCTPKTWWWINVQHHFPHQKILYTHHIHNSKDAQFLWADKSADAQFPESHRGIGFRWWIEGPFLRMGIYFQRFKYACIYIYTYYHHYYFFYCNILFSANEHSYGMGSSHQQVQPRSSDLPSSLRAFRKWQVEVSPSAAYCGLLRPYPHGILPHLCDAKSV